ncbi:MAG: hypothetical protein JKY95_08325 [Planctomycetaceae bacterium]|nr:hypothetical protein [Planctomycetaceae bacterium]
MKSCAIGIPVYSEEPSRGELIAFNNVLEILSEWPIYLIAPEGMDVSIYSNYSSEIQVIRFSPEYFVGRSGYNKLLLSKHFYQAFSAYEYLLIHQLDAFVFRDELALWCERGIDYIGAPWYEAPGDRRGEAKVDAPLLGVGNGGFSLRRVSSSIKVLSSWRLIEPFPRGIRSFLKQFVSGKLLSNRFCSAAHKLKINEDRFWSEVVPVRFPWFQIPSPFEAVSFAFEVNPRKCFELNGSELPFGCHAWEKYDPDFWTNFISDQYHTLGNTGS